MENKSYPASKHSLIYGIYISIALIVLTLIFYVMDLHTEQWPGYIGYIFMLGGIIYASVQYRDKRLGGFATYGQCFSAGFLAGLFASIITAIFTFFYISMLGEAYVADMMAISEEKILSQNPEVSDEELDMALGFAKNMMKPWWISIIALLANTFFSLIFSLITSIFIKKENPDAAAI